MQTFPVIIQVQGQAVRPAFRSGHGIGRSPGQQQLVHGPDLGKPFLFSQITEHPETGCPGLRILMFHFQVLGELIQQKTGLTFLHFRDISENNCKLSVSILHSTC